MTKLTIYSKLLILSVLIISAHLSLAQAAQEIQLKEINGDYLTLEDLKGSELTVIDFWASWCKPCVKSIPKIVELSHEYDRTKVNFVGINVDSPRNSAKVRPFSKSLGIDYPTLLDPNQELYSELLVSVLPTLFILDSNGRVLYAHEGYVGGDEKLIKDKIESLLADE